MLIHTTITFRRNGEPIGTEARSFRACGTTHAETKAMRWAEGHRLFPCSTDIRILCTTPTGPNTSKTTSLCWLLAHTPVPIPEIPVVQP